MPAYKYRAVDISGRIAQGSLAAANEWELAQNLTEAGLELIEARTRKDAVQTSMRWPRHLSPRLLTQFTSQMTDLLQSGIPFAAALRDMAQATQAGVLRDACDDIHRAINHGRTIAEAFALHPRLFPSVFIAILAAGEKSGDLVATFSQLARYCEARARTVEQVSRAVRYPLFLLLVALGVITFMATMVIPQVVQFLSTIDSELPLTTRILVAASQAIADYWWAALVVVAALGLGLRFAHKYSESAARIIDGWILRLPLVGMIIQKLALARFAHSFAILFQSGIGILASLRGAAVTLGNRALIEALENAAKQVQSGRALSAAMIGIFPPFAVHMMRIGERSGRLTKALDDIASACDREVTDVTGRLIGLMEPALTLTIGSLLAWIVLAVLGPIYGSIAKITGSG